MSSINYAIDITRPRIKSAMLALGVHPEELIKKSLEDFAGRNVSDEVQQLRYNYYARKLKEVIRQLTAFIKEENLRKMKTSLDKPKSPAVFLTQLSTCEETVDEIQEMKNQVKNRIGKDWEMMRKLEGIQKGVDDRLSNGDKARERVKSQVLERMKMKRKFQERQVENLARIQEEAERRVEEYDRRAEEGLRKKRAQSIDYSMISTSRRPLQDLENGLDVDSKLQQFEAKMQRSWKNHEKSLQSRREALLTLRKPVRSPSLNDSSLTDVLKMMKKQEKVQARRHSLLQLQQEYRQKLRQKHENRRSVALDRLKDDELKEKSRTQAIEIRMKASEDLLKEKHENWVKEIELRNELSRLRDEEALLNAERKRRVM